MKTKRNIRTIRLTNEENGQIEGFLSSHPYLNNFSTLVRAALWDYLKKLGQETPPAEGPAFLWDYDLSAGEIRELLAGPQKKRLWLVAKILEQARWKDIWDYLTLDQIRRDLPYLKLSPRTRQHWEDALRQWKKSA